MSINLVVLTGRLTNDPDFRTVASGKAVANFTLAVSRFKRDETDFINCVAWSNVAEILRKYTAKGDMVGISGHLQVRQYEKDGQKRHATEVIVETVDLLERKKASDAPRDESFYEEEELPY